MKRLLLWPVLLSGLTFGACKKNNDTNGGTAGGFTAKVSFIIDGDNFKHQTITISGQATNSDNGAIYFTKSKATSVDIGDAHTTNDDDKNHVGFFFNGTSTGTQKVGDKLGNSSNVIFEVDATDSKGNLYNYIFLDTSQTPGTIAISKYGAVGQLVEGTFSGTLISETGYDFVKITNGTFSVTRQENNDN